MLMGYNPPDICIDHSQSPFTWHYQCDGEFNHTFELSPTPVQDACGRDGDLAEITFSCLGMPGHGHVVARGRLEFYQGYWLLSQAHIVRYVR